MPAGSQASPVQSSRLYGYMDCYTGMYGDVLGLGVAGFAGV